MNDIVRPLTPDGMCGWDAHGQLWLWKVDGKDRSGSIIGDPRGHKCRICLQGWMITVESLADQHFWHDHEEWVHKSCFVRYLSMRERDFWYGALVEARFRFEKLQEIPNEYFTGADDPWSKRPWYRVKLVESGHAESGHALKLGRRKRVYHMEIECGNAPYSQADAVELFKKEEVTKSVGVNGLHVHTWCDAKARDYMKAFAKILGVAQETPLMEDA